MRSMKFVQSSQSAIAESYEPSSNRISECVQIIERHDKLIPGRFTTQSGKLFVWKVLFWILVLRAASFCEMKTCGKALAAGRNF